MRENVDCHSRQPVLPRISIADLSLEGDVLPPADQQALAADLKAQTYTGELEGAKDELVERVRAAWQNHGYFEPQVEGEARVLTSSPVSERIGVTIRSRSGPQYRLGWIHFRNNRAIANVKALRSVFPVRDGDIASRKEIAQGLKALRDIYTDLGYINFTSVPDAQIEPDNNVVNLLIDIDEGKQFYISAIDTAGLNESASRSVLEHAYQKKGDIYNQRLERLSLENYSSWLPADRPVDLRIHLEPDERAGTVAVILDFRPCPADHQSAH